MRLTAVVLACTVALLSGQGPATSRATSGVLALHPDNPHYFLWRTKPAVLITSGEHYGALLNLDFDYRKYIDTLAADERPVGDIVDALELAQPSVSKHLRVLRDVDLVRARRDGRRVLYRTNAGAIRPLHEWAATFERLWRHQLNRIKERAERG